MVRKEKEVGPHRKWPNSGDCNTKGMMSKHGKCIRCTNILYMSVYVCVWCMGEVGGSGNEMKRGTPLKQKEYRVMTNRLQEDKRPHYSNVFSTLAAIRLSKNDLGPIVIIVIQFGLHDLPEGFVVV